MNYLGFKMMTYWENNDLSFHTKPMYKYLCISTDANTSTE